MLALPTDKISVTEGESCYRRRKYVVMDAVKEVANGTGKVSWFELMQRLTEQDYGLTRLKAAQKIRSLVDHGLLFPIEDSALILFSTRKTTTEFQRWQCALQQAWLHANEMDALNVFREESKSLQKFEKLQPPTKEEERG